MRFLKAEGSRLLSVSAVAKALVGALPITASGLIAAHAADLPSRVAAPVYVPPPMVTSWTGLYVGINGGGSVDHVASPYNFNRPDVQPRGFSGYTERGPLAGGQIGYNMQFHDVPFVGRLPLLSGYRFLDNVVVGAEVDSDWSDINGARTVATAFGPATFGTRIKNFGTLRTRGGYSFGQLLVYLHTGWSYATTENYFKGFGFSGDRTTTRFPLLAGTWGIGAEYRLSQNWSVRAEYLYDYIDARQTKFFAMNGNSFDYMSRTSFHVGRAALNYHFDLFGSTPVVARY